MERARSSSARSDLRPPRPTAARYQPRVDDVIFTSLYPHAPRLLVDVVRLLIIRVDDAIILPTLVPLPGKLAPNNGLHRAPDVPSNVLLRRCATRHEAAVGLPGGLRGQRRELVRCRDRRLRGAGFRGTVVMRRRLGVCLPDPGYSRRNRRNAARDYQLGWTIATGGLLVGLHAVRVRFLFLGRLDVVRVHRLGRLDVALVARDSLHGRQQSSCLLALSPAFFEPCGGGGGGSSIRCL